MISAKAGKPYYEPLKKIEAWFSFFSTKEIILCQTLKCSPFSLQHVAAISSADATELLQREQHLLGCS